MRSRQRERETGLEPATNSLEGCDSSQLSYSRKLKIKISKNLINYVRFEIQVRRLSSGRRGIRTPKGVSQRIYSPPRLSNSGVRPDTFHPLSQKASNKYRGSNLKKQESRYNFLLLLLILVYFKPFLIIL